MKKFSVDKSLTQTCIASREEARKKSSRRRVKSKTTRKALLRTNRSLVEAWECVLLSKLKEWETGKKNSSLNTSLAVASTTGARWTDFTTARTLSELLRTKEEAKGKLSTSTLTMNLLFLMTAATMLLVTEEEEVEVEHLEGVSCPRPMLLEVKVGS